MYRYKTIVCKAMYSWSPQRKIWSASRQTVFRERTFVFSKQDMDAIRATCTEENVHGLSSGRWKTNDGNSRKNHKGSLDLSRAGELATHLLLCKIYAEDNTGATWSVGRPDFSRRPKGHRDRGDIQVEYGWDSFWVEVKTTTNNKGPHTLKNCNRVAKENGYTFQKQIWDKKLRRRVLTATFDPEHEDYKRANSRLLVGCVGTYTRDGGAVITVSSGTFLLPVSECKWARRNYYADGDEDLKMVHHDQKFI